jgi:phospholipase D1/2
MIRKAKKFIYIENQFFISATKEGGVVKNLIMQGIAERVEKAISEG